MRLVFFFWLLVLSVPVAAQVRSDLTVTLGRTGATQAEADQKLRAALVRFARITHPEVEQPGMKNEQGVCQYSAFDPYQRDSATCAISLNAQGKPTPKALPALQNIAAKILRQYFNEVSGAALESDRVAAARTAAAADKAADNASDPDPPPERED